LYCRYKINNLKTNLKNIASILTGIYGKPENEGAIIYLQVKDFSENGELKQVHPQLNGNIPNKHLLKAGDILFAAKGTKNFAACFYGLNYPAVASTSFFIIRLQNPKILPEYLVWYLNHPINIDRLKSSAIGTSIVSITKEVLGNIEISIPDMNVQRKVLMITALQQKEKSIKQQINLLNDKIIQYRILDAINYDRNER
jgi:restriction endonuclease S subunit